MDEVIEAEELVRKKGLKVAAEAALSKMLEVDPPTAAARAFATQVLTMMKTSRVRKEARKENEGGK